MKQSWPRALEGVRVLDTATMLAGPFAATLLADFGAEVIKVELPGQGDWTRQGPGLGPGRGFLWLQEARNKKAVTLDLHKAEGQQLLKRLASLSDAMIENFRPGKLEEWGLAPEMLLGLNPSLVLLRISGYGQTGPYRRRGAFDRTASAFGGSQYVTGYPDSPPVRAGYALADYMTGYAGAFALATALHWRDARGGRGQVIDLALYETVLRASEASIPMHHHTGEVRERMGNENPFVVPSSSFPTGDGKWVVLSGNTERLWQRLAHAIERPELLTDPRFTSSSARRANADALYRILEEWTRGRVAAEIVATLNNAKVPAATVNSIADIFSDPHVQERESIVPVEDPLGVELAVAGVIPKMSATPGRIDHLGPELGSSNEEIYGELLGLSADEIRDLERRGVI